ncbi:MAG: zinc-dependent metalloprotease [Vulcanimicrobiaceae bacterium]
MSRSTRALFVAAAAAALLAWHPDPGIAKAAAPPAATAAPAGAPAAYDDFIKGATVEPGLIPIVLKGGEVYLALAKDQLDADFIATMVPTTGIGGVLGFLPGEPYVAPARILHFARAGNKVVLRWPNRYARVMPGSPQAQGTNASLPSSIIAVEPIVAEDATNGTVVISAKPFLGDVADADDSINAAIKNPEQKYHLDPTRSFFRATKAFVRNDVLHVTQTWVTPDAEVVDNAPDPRSIEVGITYNIIAAPNDGYLPRRYDPRVGYFAQPLLNFESDRTYPRNIYDIIRWNFGPSDPAHPAATKNPLVFYLSNDIPVAYRDTVGQALLTWNAAFEKIGILDAVQVQQQPDDPAWDPEDIDHNVVRWVDTSSPEYGAEALIMNDPRTGEELNVGINVDSVIASDSPLIWKYLIAPARGLPDTVAAEDQFRQQLIRAVVLHESGHDFGFQHNFIGSMAYTAKDLQSASFTQRNGIVSSVMEYEPFANLWPKGTPQGDYEQLVLGPYDYYAIAYGYEPVAGATTPEAELPTLRARASRWNDPRYRFASDEDADFEDGHAIDPRVQQFDLTNHPLAWAQVQLGMLHGIMDRVAQNFPQPGHTYAQARQAFLVPLRQYLGDATMAAHTIGGEYLSRALPGEPGPTVPLTPVSRAQEYRAFGLLDRNLFADAAWRFPPSVLTRLTYDEVSPFPFGPRWAYNPPPRHDVPVVEMAAEAQDAALDEMYAPLTLQRIDELQTKYPDNATMSLTDLFSWSLEGIYGDLHNGSIASIGVVRRNLQVRYLKRLATMWTKPTPGAPSDAQALARYALEQIAQSAAAAERRPHLSELVRAHLAALRALAKNALTPSPLNDLDGMPPGGGGM